MIDLHLHGALAELAPEPLRLEVATPAEAIRACEVLLPGFRAALERSDWQIEVDGERLEGPERLTLGFGAASRCDVRPAFAGAGVETALWIFAAAALATAAYAVAAIPDIGDYGDREEPDRRPSYLFAGGRNALAQGGCVPLVYGGPVRVGSVQVSASLVSERIPVVEPGDADDRDTDTGRRVRFEGRGGGGGSARQPVEGDNTLQTRATLRAVDLIGEGEMRGLVDGLKSCYLDGTQIQNDDGSMNIEGVAVEWLPGTPDQDALEGIEESSTAIRFSVRVTRSAPVVRTVQRKRDAARVTLRFPRLSTVEADGDIRGSQVRFRIEAQPNGGAWEKVVEQTISDKSTSPAELSWRVPLDGAAPHSVRVTRLTADSDSDRLHNDLYWVGLDEIVDVRQSYPHSAVVAITAEADKYDGDVHRREYEVYGLLVDVPSNYDPATRAYAGLWDGTFRRAWTDNGAWVAWDLLRSRRYGLGADLPSAYVDAAKWEFYAAAQWNDQMVPDGRGGTEPRFRFSGVVQRQQDAKRLLDGVLGAFRSALYYGAGAGVPVQDSPADPVALVGDANVAEGEFRYGDALADRERSSAVAVSFSDPADGYRLGIELVVDDDLVARHGWRRRDVAAMYCTSRSQAHRLGLHVLREQERESGTLRYRAGLDHASLRPGDVIRQTDSRRAGERLAVRVTTTALTRMDSWKQTAANFHSLRFHYPLPALPAWASANPAWLAWLTVYDTGLVGMALTDNPDSIVRAYDAGPHLSSAGRSNLAWRITPVGTRSLRPSPSFTVDSLFGGDTTDPYEFVLRGGDFLDWWRSVAPTATGWVLEWLDNRRLRCDALPAWGVGGWSAHVVLPDGSVQTSAVERFEGAAAVLESGLRSLPVDGAIAVLQQTASDVRLWWIVALAEASGLEVAVQARSYDPGRYAAVETGRMLDAADQASSAALPAPTAVDVVETAVEIAAAVQVGVTVGVSAPADARIAAVVVELRQLDAADTDWRPAAWTRSWSIDIAPVPPGRVQARARFVAASSALRSPWTESQTVLLAGSPAPAAPTSVAASPTDTGYVVSWAAPQERDYAATEIRDGDPATPVADAVRRGTVAGTRFATDV